MSAIAIRVENLSKRYTIGVERHDTLRDALSDFRLGILDFGRKHPKSKIENPKSEEFWALRDVSFEVRRGEVVGVIGRNGAGKSTLLKILSRITEPTSGHAEIHGRVGSLLEVGTGFHPELTGRENIYLNGAILGMKRTEIARKFDEIVAFSEIEKFLDTPVKRYSSGMYVRLAFAVAAHLEPEILLVDEVLAVGDASFQKKCLGKMGDIAGEGRTVLFVSHNMQAISTLTYSSLLLSHGECDPLGATSYVISKYLQQTTDVRKNYLDLEFSLKPKITEVHLCTSEPGNVHVNGQALQVHFEISTPVSINGAALSFQVVNSLGQSVVHLWTFDSDISMCRQPGVYHVVCTIPKFRLYMGTYTLTVHFSEHAGGEKYQTIEGICPFKVTMYGKVREFKWHPDTCVYIEDCEWNIKVK